jgi:hypothetical protein
MSLFSGLTDDRNRLAGNPRVFTMQPGYAH